MYIKENILYSPWEILKLYPNISFPNGAVDEAFTEQEGFSKVVYGNVPAINEATQKVILNEMPTLINGIYVLEYSIVEKTEEEKIAYAKSLVPQSITPLQAKLQLLNMGLLDEVEAMVSADRRIALYWEYALDIQRSHTTLSQMAEALGLTDAQLDEMFIEASKLS